VRERIRDRMRRTPDFLNPRLYGQRVSKALLGLFSDFSPSRQAASERTLRNVVYPLPAPL
jgi:hypothetical protein